MVLIFTQKPGANDDAGIDAGVGLDFSSMSGAAIATSPALEFKARDATKLRYRLYENSHGPLIIVLHGSGAHGGLYDTLAQGLIASGTVVVPDLRGHGGQLPTGDVQYIGQLEDDLTDLINATRSGADQQVVLVGHSSGGGLAIRYSGNSNQPGPDAVVLLAPYVGYNATTTRANSGGWAQPLTRRIIGLTMLNALKIRVFNHLKVISFRLPQNGRALQMTDSYSYRLNTSFAPRREYAKDLEQLPRFSVLVGSDDEAFIAAQYPPLFDSLASRGSVEILEGLTHLDVIGSELVHRKTAEFIASLSDTPSGD